MDKDSYPDRFQQAVLELESRSTSKSNLEHSIVEDGTSSDNEYVPNEVPIFEQIKNVVLSISVIVFGGLGVVENDLAVTACRTCETVYHLKDEAAWVMYAAMLLMAAGLISEVVDHYDKRDNEHLYHRISNFTMLPGLGLFFLAFYLHSR
ncbi:hypothetical protein [Bowmanella denitrificans]|uniref:hypothetical protein n=1 Tax=Bowmanella denitrificans TaxID=366582 RepID=UPI000C9AACB7|nr:hypothetical protein [Bowmanella denitrificans]